MNEIAIININLIKDIIDAEVIYSIGHVYCYGNTIIV